MLSDKQLKKVCLFQQGAGACRYAVVQYLPNYKVQCQKLVSVSKSKIDQRVADHLKKCKQAGVDPYDSYVAIGKGLNCSGFVPLETVMQGL
jgi:hypothetical protein